MIRNQRPDEEHDINFKDAHRLLLAFIFCLISVIAGMIMFLL